MSANPALHFSARPSVQMLIVGWCIWLLVAWVVLWSQMEDGSVMVRWLMLSATIGMLVVWPLVRLSQRGSVSGVILDWLALNVVWQAVVWPLISVAHWPIAQVAWQSVALASWSLGVGWVIAVGGRSSRGFVRAFAMLACLLFLVGEPVAMIVLDTPWRMWVSPIEMLWAMSQRGGYFQLKPWPVHILAMTGVCCFAWLAFSGYLLLKKPTSV